MVQASPEEAYDKAEDVPEYKAPPSQHVDPHSPVIPVTKLGLSQRIAVMQTNPKSGKSRERYERYRRAKTVGEYLELGGTRKDLRCVWG